ncbi:MAG: hypothetical protein LBE91_12355 [Tannerella sp.]|nr:hypothetical protein [Tannerella sp.]
MNRSKIPAKPISQNFKIFVASTEMSRERQKDGRTAITTHLSMRKYATVYRNGLRSRTCTT